MTAASASFATLALTTFADARRRARMRDVFVSRTHAARDVLGKGWRDARNRAHGVFASAGELFGGVPIDDEQLAERVRSRLGRLVAHPHALSVTAVDGCITLKGAVLPSEVVPLVRGVRGIRGVERVDSQLVWRDRTDDASSSPGRASRRHVPELRQEHWTPSLRIAAALTGFGALAVGFARGATRFGVGLGTAGALLFARSMLDVPIGRVLGIDRDSRAIELEKTITIHAPIEEVFSYWADFEKFPSFMDHVESVKKMNERGSHWRVRGPLGRSVEWDAEVTRYAINEMIAWETVGKPAVRHAGVVRFEPADGGRATRIHVRMTYSPVAGILGHAVASAFHVDPKRSFDEDLLRLKSLLEEGRATAHHRAVTRDVN